MRSAHIGGAKAIRLDEPGRQREIGSAVRNGAASSNISYDDRLCVPTYEIDVRCVGRALEGEERGAGVHHDRTGWTFATFLRRATEARCGLPPSESA